ncbi:hypothetical protein CRENBAI_023290 [Crenichthys baileyi]|uniref:Uncharacterized protein n=1 Tax=Crenichthys baileyi TaxID=28760 RepID=A0AAV9QS50_9TELE
MLVESLLLSAASHPSIHQVLLLCFTTSSSLVVCRLEGQPPYSDTLTHADTHLRDVSLPIPPASSYHSPLTALSTHTCYFPPSVFALINFPGPLLVLPFTPPCPPSPHACVTTAVKKEETCSSRQVKNERENKAKEEKTVKSGAFVEHSDACVRNESEPSLMEYPGRRRAEGGRRLTGLPVIASRGYEDSK